MFQTIAISILITFMILALIFILLMLMPITFQNSAYSNGKLVFKCTVESAKKFYKQFQIKRYMGMYYLFSDVMIDFSDISSIIPTYTNQHCIAWPVPFKSLIMKKLNKILEKENLEKIKGE